MDTAVKARRRAGKPHPDIEPRAQRPTAVAVSRPAPASSGQAREKAAVLTLPPARQQVSQPAASSLDYLIDRWQRSVLFIDVLRQRADNIIDHERAALPPPLKFNYETILDARRFERPANYGLPRITVVGEDCLEDGIDPAKPPVIVIDPRAGHSPGHACRCRLPHRRHGVPLTEFTC
jgi:uncharacterized protein DUF3141